jgi:hypothetical protein
MKTPVKIRGIYTTALTKLLLDSGYPIAEPSPEIMQRFHLEGSAQEPEVLIQDLQNHQGIRLTGEADQLSDLVRLLQKELLDAVLLDFGTLPDTKKGRVWEIPESKELDVAEVEFGGTAKESLDRIRSIMTPTLKGHHRLRPHLPKCLEAAEKKLHRNPEQKEKLEKKIFKEQILTPLCKGTPIKIDHIKIAGKPIRPREGILVQAKGRKILMKRIFSQGRYDGLDLPIEEGDYGLTEIEEGRWYVKHSYYARNGKLKGEYFNINTPAELYPYGGRYLDLEVDIVCPIDHKPFLVDQEDLSLLAQNGQIGPDLMKKALETAERLLAQIS